MPCSTGKRAYKRRRYAIRALKRIQPIKPTGQSRVRRAYHCNLCGLWHLTSQDQRTKPA